MSRRYIDFKRTCGKPKKFLELLKSGNNEGISHGLEAWDSVSLNVSSSVFFRENSHFHPRPEEDNWRAVRIPERQQLAPSLGYIFWTWQRFEIMGPAIWTFETRWLTSWVSAWQSAKLLQAVATCSSWGRRTIRPVRPSSSGAATAIHPFPTCTNKRDIFLTTQMSPQAENPTNDDWQRDSW